MRTSQTSFSSSNYAEAITALWRFFSGAMPVWSVRLLTGLSAIRQKRMTCYRKSFSSSSVNARFSMRLGARRSARSWIVQVTYHRAIDRRRHLASRNFYLNAELDEALVAIEEPMADTAFYERSIEGMLGIEMLGRIEEALSRDQLRTIQLYFFDGYSFEEIADLTGQTAGNVRNHYYRGLERIRKLIFKPKPRTK